MITSMCFCSSKTVLLSRLWSYVCDFEIPLSLLLVNYVSDGCIKWTSFSIVKLIELGVVVLGVTALSFGPFIIMVRLNIKW